jgi:hypothetical protein
MHIETFTDTRTTEIVGYCIYFRYWNKTINQFCDWKIDWNKKIYATKSIAEIAILQFGKRMDESTEYKIIELLKLK